LVDVSPVVRRLLSEVKATQVVVLAGGQGRRLGVNMPKPLVRLAGERLIDRCVGYYSSCGFSDFVVLTGYGASEVEEHLRQEHSGVKVCRDPFDHSVKPVGKAKALKHALEVGVIDAGRRALIVFPDDVFLDGELPVKLLMHHLQAVRLYGVWATAVFAYPAVYPFGVGEVDSRNLVTSFKEKPRVDIATSTGMYLFEERVYGLMREVDMDADRAVEFEEVVVPRLAKEERLYAYMIPGDLWIPVNTRKDLERAERKLSSTWLRRTRAGLTP